MDSDLSVWLYKQLVCRLIGSVLPPHWFGPRPPATAQLSTPTGRPQLEIVSHCWQYAHLSVYQLSSIVLSPPQDLDLTYTLYYAEEDTGTAKLVETFGQIQVPGVRWNWQPLPRGELFRRSIGRNRSALETTAHWIWFADCDLIFHRGCLDSLAAALTGQQHRLAFPASERITPLLPADHPLVNRSAEQHEVVDIDADLFSDSAISKAKGAFQIVRGDVARTCGYCRDLKQYQRPTLRWRKTFEDTAFRRLIADEGSAIPVIGLHRIRHQEKGRYAANTALTGLRQNLRQISDAQTSQKTSTDEHLHEQG